MEDLSLKPRQPEKEKRSFSSAEKKGAAIFTIGILLATGLAFFLLNIRNCANQKIIDDTKASMNDSVKTIVKIDTVYVPGKVVESDFEACYDVSDCNTILITVKNGVIEVSNND